MYPSRLRAGLLVLVAAVFTALGVFVAASGEPAGLVVGTALALLSGLCGAVVLARLCTRRPVLVLDERGIAHRTSLAGPGFLPWSQVTMVFPLRRRLGPNWISVVGANEPGGGAMYIMTAALPLPVDQTLCEIGAVAPEHVWVDVPEELSS
jgi:hypothetical protein